MRIYTRTGDEGETGLLGGIRVPKDHLRIAAYGEIDELNSWIGALRRVLTDAGVDSFLGTIQNLLLEAGTEMATPPGSRYQPGGIRDEDVQGIEAEIDRLEAILPPLTNFILPGGSEGACRAHLARCSCRRAERAVVHLLRGEPAETSVLRFLNRLSDLLFVMARWANVSAGVPDVIWHARPRPDGGSDKSADSR
jgi:cob(I)alamin adenosyltransferase